MNKYILKYRKPVICENLHKWMKWFGRAHRRVRRTQIGEQWVSTSFLGIDHNFSGLAKHPVVFETMVFGGDDDIQIRTETWRDALSVHWATVNRLKRKNHE